jgi:2-C-methyl-D-erythritol 2,4-cyclodiphosphate synthase
VDLTVVCERPRVGLHADAIRRSLAAALDVAPADVSVKGKSNEGMGWEGKEEGLAVHAVALLRAG